MHEIKKPRVRFSTEDNEALCFKHAVELAQKGKAVKAEIEDASDFICELQCSVCKEFLGS